MRNALTAQRARSLLKSDAQTGDLTWLDEARVGFHKSAIMHRAGDKAGTVRNDGRVVVRVDGRLYLAHRVAWLIETGEWPIGEIDHINGDPADNRRANMRCGSRSVNQQNMRAATRFKKSCNLLGVYANPRNATSPWRACITTCGKHRQIGVYKTAEEAYAAYVAAKRSLHEGCTL